MVDIENLRREAIRLYPADPAAARLLQQAGDEIQRLRVQRDALMESARLRRAEVPHG
jgi:hypothetical protein